jgi:hypothetical protein
MSEIDVAQMLAEAEAEFAAAETEPEDDSTGFAAFSKMCAPSAEQAAANARQYSAHDKKNGGRHSSTKRAAPISATTNASLNPY